VSLQPDRPAITVVLSSVEETAILSPDGLATARAVLDDDEWAQLGRMRAAGRRAQFILSRRILRAELSRRADVAPHDWRFKIRDGGQPVLAPGFSGLGLHFTISHTKALVGVAVSSSGPVGIDLEALARAPDINEVRTRVFHESELERLDVMGDRRRHHLVELWTGKEAVSKCLGRGLGIDFRTLALDAPDTDLFMPMLHGIADYGRWFCRSATAPHDHILALAASRREDIEAAGFEVDPCEAI
jgi:4'-phosphopantetheinyl transferase